MFKVGDAVEVKATATHSGKKEYGEIVSGPKNYGHGNYYDVTLDAGFYINAREEDLSYISLGGLCSQIDNASSTVPVAGRNITATTTKPTKPAENYTDWYAEEEAKRKQKYKDEGRCMDCGTLMYFHPRSWDLVCPTHGSLINSKV